MRKEKINKTIFFFTTISCIALFYNVSICQTDSMKTSSSIQERIIFKSEKTNPSIAKDSVNTPKIIFSKNLLLDSKKIQVLSENEYRIGSYNYSIGDEGFNLKESMKNNHAAVQMVDDAYSSRKTGTIMMVVGGIIACAGIIATATWVKTHEVDNGSVRTTYYWLPGITIGAIVGGLGYIEYNSVHKSLIEAADYYNAGL